MMPKKRRRQRANVPQRLPAGAGRPETCARVGSVGCMAARGFIAAPVSGFTVRSSSSRLQAEEVFHVDEHVGDVAGLVRLSAAQIGSALDGGPEDERVER